ncbi:MAG TPA: hypothetical protein VGC92_00290, partial [Phenylobacterium sp.]
MGKGLILAVAVAGAIATACVAQAGPRGAAHPDLTGVWSNASYTWLQRPKGLTSLAVTPAQAEAYEAPRRRLKGELSSPEDEVGQDESEFPDNGSGLARIGGEIRSSWILDPADGRIPWRPEVKAALQHGRDSGLYDNVEARDTDERCLTGASGFAPLVNSHDANLIQIVQTPGWVAIVGEKNHEVRIVSVAQRGAAPPREAPGGWMGVSRGRWEGATLVVETTGLRAGRTKVHDQLWLSEHARVTERFTRTGPGQIDYRFE